MREGEDKVMFTSKQHKNDNNKQPNAPDTCSATLICVLNGLWLVPRQMVFS